MDFATLTFDTLVSLGTFGTLCLKFKNAEFILCVRLRSFLLADVRCFGCTINELLLLFLVVSKQESPYM